MPKFSKFQEWRKKMGLTQGQLGEKLGVIQTVVSDWEGGRSPVPAEKLARLRELGYDGPAAATEAPPLTREDFEEFMKSHIALLMAEIHANTEELKLIRGLLSRKGQK